MTSRDHPVSLSSLPAAAACEADDDDDGDDAITDLFSSIITYYISINRHHIVTLSLGKANCNISVTV